MRTQREAIVTSSGGTSSASTTKIVAAGGSSIVFSSFGATAAVMRWNSSRTSTLRSPSIGESDAARHDVVGLLDRDRRALALDDQQSRDACPRVQAAASRSSRSAPGGASSAAANACAAARLPLPDGPTNR